jgi:hypothetical protein
LPPNTVQSSRSSPGSQAAGAFRVTGAVDEAVARYEEAEAHWEAAYRDAREKGLSQEWWQYAYNAACVASMALVRPGLRQDPRFEAIFERLLPLD